MQDRTLLGGEFRWRVLFIARKVWCSDLILGPALRGFGRNFNVIGRAYSKSFAPR
jgi:hypothetical protein